MLVRKPRRVICKVGTYDITVSSDNDLENGDKFDKFCQEFKMVLMSMVASTKKEVKANTKEATH